MHILTICQAKITHNICCNRKSFQANQFQMQGKMIGRHSPQYKIRFYEVPRSIKDNLVSIQRNKHIGAPVRTKTMRQARKYPDHTQKDSPWFQAHVRQSEIGDIWAMTSTDTNSARICWLEQGLVFPKRSRCLATLPTNYLFLSELQDECDK